MTHHLSRREVLARATTGLGAATVPSEAPSAIYDAEQSSAPSFRYCLNTGTIRG
jgi:hypothetical protein